MRASRVRMARLPGARVVAVLLVLLVLLAAGPACRKHGAERAPAAEAQIRRPWAAEPANALPFLEPADGYSQLLGRYVYEGLVAVDAHTGQVTPALASRVEVAADGLTVKAELRAGVVFHDGTPVTVQDVLATFEAVRDARSPTWTLQRALSDLGGVRAEGERGVVFTWKHAYYRAQRVLADVVIVPARLARNAFASPTVRRQAPGTGPFTIAEWRTGQWIRLARNDRYWGEKPAAREVVLRLIPDPTTQLAAFRRGDLDLVPVGPAAFKAEEQELSGDPRWRVLRYPRAHYWVVHMNNRRAPLSDARARRGLERIVDRDAMNRAFFDGAYAPIRGPVMPGPTGLLGFDAPPPADVEAGRKLLAEAGVTKGTKLVLRAPAAGADVRQVTESIRDQLSMVGIEVEVREADWAQHLAALGKKDFDLALLQEQGSLDVDARDTWHSSGRENVPGYANPKVDALLVRAGETVDDAARGELLGDAARLIAGDMPSLFLWRAAAIVLVSRRLGNVEPSPLTGLDDMRRWTVTRASASP